jgi:hypothetical protein
MINNYLTSIACAAILTAVSVEPDGGGSGHAYRGDRPPRATESGDMNGADEETCP